MDRRLVFFIACGIAWFGMRHHVFAQYLYQLDLNKPSTYNTTCGTITSSKWTVSNQTCSLTTSEIQIDSTLPPNSTYYLPITLRFESSGNSDDKDSLYVEVSINGTWQLVSVQYAKNNTNTVSFGVMVGPRDIAKIRITATNNRDTEKWRMATGDLSALVPSKSPLPVDYMDFRHVPLYDHIRFSWTTVSERDAAFFVMEKSVDGIHFFRAGTIPAHGISFSSIHYDFDDGEPVEGLSYYRLALMNFSGNRIFLTDPIDVRFEHRQDNKTTIYPNPSRVHDVLKARGYFSSNTELTVSDVYGNRCLQFKSFTDEDIANIPSMLGPGLFVLTFRGSSVFSTKLLIDDK
jgi:hypothetical protein